MKKTLKKILCICIMILICITSAPISNVSAANTVQIPEDAVEFNGHFYKSYNDSKSWTEARVYCEDLGGHLVTITSQEEQSFVESAFLTNSPKMWFYLVGGYRQNVNSTEWHWITDENFYYNNWVGLNESTQTISNQIYIWIVSSSAPDKFYDMNKYHSLIDFKWYSHTNYSTDSTFDSKHTGFICEWDPNEYTISGKITGGSNTSRLAIDGVWYDYDLTVEGLTETIELFAIGEEITCKIRFGKIVACSKTEIRNKVTLSANTTNNKIKYDYKTNMYSPECIQLNINITNNIYSTSQKVIDTQYVAGYDITIDKLVINAANGDMFYFEDGWFGLEKTQILEKVFDSPVTLKIGETLNFSEDLIAYINDKYIWGETKLEKEIKIYAYAYSGDSYIAFDELTVTFNNENAQNAIKNNAETEAQSQVAADILNQTACIIQNKFLSEIFTPDQLKSIQSAIQCKIALCALPESTYKKAGINDKIIEKLMNKAGVSKDWLGTAYTADIKLEVNVDTEKYGQLKVEFKIPFDYFSFGSDNPYGGISFDFGYEVVGGKGKKDVPSEYLSGDILGLGTYANMKTFSDSVQKVALAQLESAYNLGYGDDLNKVGDMLFGGTVTKILSKTAAKSYSHLTFSMMVFPSKQISIKCPVDVFVYDEEGNLCLSVEQNEITMSCEDIDIEVIGNEKYLTIYDGDYSIEIIATANGEMTITIDEYSTSSEMIRVASFDNLLLVPGDLFKTQVDETYVENEYILTYNEDESISSNSDECYIHCIKPIEFIDKEATCIENGVKHIECAVCKETTSIESISALGHTHTSEITTPATHLTEGVETFTCECGDSYTQVIEKISTHTYKAVINKPTCTEQGFTAYICECGDTYNIDYVNATGHTEVVDNAVAPTYEKTGLTEGKHCSVCDTILVAQQVVTKLPAPVLKIRNNPGSTTLDYGNSIKLTAETANLPEGAKIYWYVDGTKKGEGTTFTLTEPQNSVTVTVKLVDENRNVIVINGSEIGDTEEIKVNNGFFQKIIAFFKKLFGLTKTIPQAFKGII